jgi:pimeloyl-ACP methyl ester carboxylesterase
MITLSDGRRLAYTAAGPEDGLAVLYLHGAIGTALSIAAEIERYGLRFICVSRPGFGASDRSPGRTILGFADDVEQLADALKVDRFAVIGVSAGGPYALACGAALGDRVSTIGVVSSLSPLCAPHAVPGMPAHISLALRALAGRPGAFSRLGDGALGLIRRYPGLLARAMVVGAPACDRQLLAAREQRAAAAEQFLTAAGGGARGLVEDYALSARPWGFALADVKPEVHVFHGVRDALVPVDHALALAAGLPRCQAWMDPDEGHFLFRRKLGDVLAALVRTSSRSSTRCQ